MSRRPIQKPPQLQGKGFEQSSREIQAFLQSVYDALSEVTVNVTLETAAPEAIVLANTAGTPADGTEPTLAASDHTHGSIKRDVRVKSAAVDVGTRNALNFVSGATVVDNAGTDSVDVTISASGTGWAEIMLLMGG